MQIVFNGDNLHEVSSPVFWKKKAETSRKHTYIILTPLNPTFI